jgi:Spy/CpxP family protein refolding chaperone
MKSTRTAAFVVVLVGLVLVAGAAAGVLVNRLRWLSEPPADVPGDGGTLVEQLHLTADQRDHMREIWESARDDIRDCYHDADSLQRQRDQAIGGILTDRQKAEFEKIAADFANRFTQLNQKRDQTIQSAIDRTNDLLDQQQRRRYQQIIRARLNRNTGTGVGSAGQPDLTIRIP